MDGEYHYTHNKAGMNASNEIIQTFSHLCNSYMSAMMSDDLPQALGVCRRILDAISGKVSKEERTPLNKDIYSIEAQLPRAESMYPYNGRLLYDNIKFRTLIKRCIEELYRELESLQDKYGYGMRNVMVAEEEGQEIIGRRE